MSLENIKLNPFNIISLYNETLVGKVLNNNNFETDYIKGKDYKNIFILLKESNFKNINENNLIFLTKMLVACKLTIDNVCIFKLKNNNIELIRIIEKFNPTKIILFGVSPTEIEMPIIFPEYHIQNYNNIQFLISESLPLIINDSALKLKLWNSLKLLFNI